MCKHITESRKATDLNNIEAEKMQRRNADLVTCVTMAKNNDKVHQSIKKVVKKPKAIISDMEIQLSQKVALGDEASDWLK